MQADCAEVSCDCKGWLHKTHRFDRSLMSCFTHRHCASFQQKRHSPQVVVPAAWATSPMNPNRKYSEGSLLDSASSSPTTSEYVFRPTLPPYFTAFHISLTRFFSHDEAQRCQLLLIGVSKFFERRSDGRAPLTLRMLTLGTPPTIFIPIFNKPTCLIYNVSISFGYLLICSLKLTFFGLFSQRACVQLGHVGHRGPRDECPRNCCS